MFGAMPLALGGGIGSELRRPLGIAIVGGLILSQLLTLFTTPVVYLYMEKAQSLAVALPDRVRRFVRRSPRESREPALTPKLAGENPELRKVR